MSLLKKCVGVRAPFLFGLIAILQSIAAEGAIISNWNTNSSGSFESAANWDNGVPASADTAVVDRPSTTFTVQFATNVVNDKARFLNGTVALQGTGSSGTYVLTNTAKDVTADRSLIIASSSGQSATVNSYLPLFQSETATVGDSAGSVGALNVLAGTTVVRNQIEVGRSGTGSLRVLNGTLLDVSPGAVLTGVLAGGSGSVELAGAGSKITSAGGLLLVGGFGSGDLYIHDGGLATGFSVFAIAAEIGSTGIARVDGAGSAVVGAPTVVGQRGNGTLNITNGGQVKSAGIIVGGGPGMGTVSVSGAGSALTISSSSLSVGSNGGNASLLLEKGGTVSSPVANIGGTATIRDTGSLWITSGVMTVEDIGKMTVSAGAQVLNAAGVIGDTSGTSRSGAVIVDGAGSTWTNTGALSIRNSLPNGSVEAANLLITNGGKVSSASGLIGASTTRRGAVIIDGLGSQWLTSGAITNGGTITVRNGGQLVAGGLLTVNSLGKIDGNGSILGNVKNAGTFAPGTSPGIFTIQGNYTQDVTGIMQIEIGGLTPGSQYDRLDVTGDMSQTVGSTLQVSLINGFMPSVGNSFDIFNFGTGGSSFSNLQLPALGGSLSWDTSKLIAQGIISVVPEPSTLVLLAIGGAVGLSSSRRLRSRLARDGSRIQVA